MGFRSRESTGHLWVPQPQQPFPDDTTLMSWGIVVDEDEIGCVLLMQRHHGWINDVIQVVSACHSTIHKV